MEAKPTVLIVDDDKDICYLLATAIQSDDIEILSAHSSKEAMILFDNNRPDLVLLDIQLPEMTGIQVLEQMKKIDNNCQIIMVTAYATIDTAIQAMKLGALDYVCKPFKLPELRETVRNAIEFLKMKEETAVTLEQVERAHIEKVLGEVDGNRRVAAERLDISLRTLYYKIKQYDIQANP
ncbi:response regulator [Aneurinibacillus sp. Ricciae_BoGa-3]|uniref:response regulator n=1 Tax=Aneurinibacillus sp. Ricciae_BoGa-3 TaxID=3022697 RepID=UPI0023408A2E|nr:response regulator [Aneurinibacillus sp. Ricciae_BoGa-3]WCK55891.1 response regulator [Aneurinibacillus sp. Ricciae_BoGa-3]